MKKKQAVARVELVPPDPERCQVEKPNGHTFMTLGGSPGLVRCANPPSVIATEIAEPHGSMSMCADCLSVFNKKFPGRATIELIRREDIR